MKKIVLLVLAGIFCFSTISFAGSGFKMVQSDHGETANLWLADQIEKSLREFPSGEGKIDDSRGATPLHFLKMLKEAGHYEGTLLGVSTYLKTLKWVEDPDRTKVFTLSRIIHTKQDKIVAWLDWKRKINTAGEGVFVDSEGNYVLASLCLNVIKKDSVVKTSVKTLIPKTKPQMKISKIPLCPCEGKGNATPPFRLRSNYEGESVILNFPRQKRIILFWIEDVNGKKVYLPEAQLLMVDENQNAGNEMNYPTLRFDASTCIATYIKWWDRVNGADRGKVYKAEEVLLNNGTIKVSVLAGAFQSNTLIIPWKVQYSKLKEEKRVKNSGSSSTGISSFLFKITRQEEVQAPEVKDLKISFSEGVLSGEINIVEDRLIEIVSFDGQLNWRIVARHGNFEIKNLLGGEYLLQVYYYPVDNNKSHLKPQIEYEEIIFLK